MTRAHARTPTHALNARLNHNARDPAARARGREQNDQRRARGFPNLFIPTSFLTPLPVATECARARPLGTEGRGCGPAGTRVGKARSGSCQTACACRAKACSDGGGSGCSLLRAPRDVGGRDALSARAARGRHGGAPSLGLAVRRCEAVRPRRRAPRHRGAPRCQLRIQLCRVRRGEPSPGVI